MNDYEPPIPTFLGLNSHGTVAAGQSITVCARPQRGFNGFRYAVAESCLGCFTIQDLRVGNCSIFPQSQDLSADAFIVPLATAKNAEMLLGRPVGWGYCQPSQDLVVMATNVSGRAKSFRSWVFGMMGDKIPTSVALESVVCPGCKSTLMSVNGSDVICPLCPP